MWCKGDGAAKGVHFSGSKAHCATKQAYFFRPGGHYTSREANGRCGQANLAICRGHFTTKKVHDASRHAHFGIARIRFVNARAHETSQSILETTVNGPFSTAQTHPQATNYSGLFGISIYYYMEAARLFLQKRMPAGGTPTGKEMLCLFPAAALFWYKSQTKTDKPRTKKDISQTKKDKSRTKKDKSQTEKDKSLTNSDKLPTGPLPLRCAERRLCGAKELVLLTLQAAKADCTPCILLQPAALVPAFYDISKRFVK